MSADVVECTPCRNGVCSHGDICKTFIRWYYCQWDGWFWRSCTCTAWREPENPFPVTITRVDSAV